MSANWELRVSAGTGPIEARRFVALLADRLARACEDAGLSILDRIGDSEDDSPRSIGLRVSGDVEQALGAWLGTHALVHDSRKHRGGRRRGHRKRWFVSVQLYPIDEVRPARLDVREVELRFARSGGPGGQHVNTSATAVHARDRATGISVRATDSRSQAHNRELALARLADKLRARATVDQQLRAREDRARRRGLVRGQAIALWQLDDRRELVAIASPTIGE